MGFNLSTEFPRVNFLCTAVLNAECILLTFHVQSVVQHLSFEVTVPARMLAPAEHEHLSPIRWRGLVYEDVDTNRQIIVCPPIVWRAIWTITSHKTHQIEFVIDFFETEFVINCRCVYSPHFDKQVFEIEIAHSCFMVFIRDSKHCERVSTEQHNVANSHV